MNPPLVSIITVTYDHPEVTCQLLGSLRKITYSPIEIIVVDNASPNDDPTIIPQTFPEVHFIQSKENIGFAGGNNLGIRVAKGKYVLLLNNDTEVDPGFLEPLVAKFETDAGMGAASPKIKFFYTPDTLQFAGLSPINPYTIRSRGYGFGVIDTGQFNQDALTNFVHGAAMMVPIEVIHKVGLMAECYFLYYEELDWATRIKNAGYDLWYIHNSVVLHKESVSTGKMSPLKVYYMNRARLLYLRRNITGFPFLVAIMYQLCISIPKNAMKFLMKGESGHFKAFHKAVLWHVKTLFSKDIQSNPLF
ncbi:MAG: glycosyltransferase family 2 protein [Bacteroidetes bacterium]|nr:glycosyltransferase family 2 protein [Bacteroidota bacterium]